MSLWLITSASAGVSFTVESRKHDTRIDFLNLVY
jgi:hypothetical protein